MAYLTVLIQHVFAEVQQNFESTIREIRDENLWKTPPLMISSKTTCL